jgi:TatD DNase family protein
MPKYFDVHSHLNFPDYDKDFDDVIRRLRDTETHTIVVGTDYESSRQAMELAEKYEEIYACIGVHPVDKKSESFDTSKFLELAKHPKVVAIGECGLDFYHAEKAGDYERQKKLFLNQIDFALKHDKPLMIHARNAYEEVLEIIKQFDDLRGNIHFFSGNWWVAQRFFDLNFTISFPGIVTFISDFDEVIKKAPLEKILSETDSPFAAPAPYRGQRSEPSYVSEVVKRIAEIREEDFDRVRAALVENALRMIRLTL